MMAALRECISMCANARFYINFYQNINFYHDFFASFVIYSTMPVTLGHTL